MLRLKHHSEPDELRRLEELFAAHQKFIFLQLAIKLNDDVYMTFEGKFDAAKFTEAFIKFAKANNIFQHQIMFLGEKILTDEVEKYVRSNEKEFVDITHPTKVFYITEAQVESLQKLDLRSILPFGYELGSADPLTDTEFITSHWRYAREGDVEETRTKLSLLPTSCIRYQNKPVAFEMLSQSGMLNHLFVVEEHRGKGLGQIVELDLCRKTARFGLSVCKSVEVIKESLINSTTRSPFWTTAKDDENSDLILVYYTIQWK